MMRTDLRPDLPRLRVPALAIHGTRDDIVMPSQIDVIRRAMPMVPFLRQLSIQGSRHFPWIDQPELFHPALLEFLRAPRAALVPANPSDASSGTPFDLPPTDAPVVPDQAA
jgi:pimeloyl-ACP methyl ester carboxylesterase